MFDCQVSYNVYQGEDRLEYHPMVDFSNTPSAYHRPWEDPCEFSWSVTDDDFVVSDEEGDEDDMNEAHEIREELKQKGEVSVDGHAICTVAFGDMIRDQVILAEELKSDLSAEIDRVVWETKQQSGPYEIESLALGKTMEEEDCDVSVPMIRMYRYCVQYRRMLGATRVIERMRGAFTRFSGFRSSLRNERVGGVPGLKLLSIKSEDPRYGEFFSVLADTVGETVGFPGYMEKGVDKYVYCGGLEFENVRAPDVWIEIMKHMNYENSYYFQLTCKWGYALVKTKYKMKMLYWGVFSSRLFGYAPFEMVRDAIIDVRTAGMFFSGDAVLYPQRYDGRCVIHDMIPCEPCKIMCDWTNDRIGSLLMCYHRDTCINNLEILLCVGYLTPHFLDFYKSMSRGLKKVTTGYLFIVLGDYVVRYCVPVTRAIKKLILYYWERFDEEAISWFSPSNDVKHGK
jgi:hypothetical protein